jgi:lipid II:glycine glycyltransferase (peptidoglycan interpeptide bridge formation enzyme)
MALMPEQSWNDLIVNLPNSHVLQTTEWAAVKSEVGWRAHPLTWKNDTGEVIAAANVLVRTMKPLSIGPKMAIGYIPRGPMLNWNDASLRQKVFTEIEQFTHDQGLIFLKIDPDLELGRGIPGDEKAEEFPLGKKVIDELCERKWRYSVEQIQFKNTAVLDLTGTEEDWLKRMKQKARYNLRLAQRSGVLVRLANEGELPALYHLYAQTASRDHFIIREEDYYLGVWRRFIQAGLADALIAEVDGQLVAGVMLFHFGKRAWYLYGMSSPLHREKMPNNLLQWEAMRLARSKGCEVYDLWGAPDVFDESDSMFGVFRFKAGLGATVIRTAGAWDYPVKPALYFVYHQVLPRILDFTRFLRRGKLQQEVR